MVKATIERTAREYLTNEGQSPYGNWLTALKDIRGKAKITKAVKQMEAGNFGDHKSIMDGLYEWRIHFGPGYRIYYITEGEEIIILFMASDKSDQQTSINQSKEYLKDYIARKPKSTAKKLRPNKGPEKKSGKSKNKGINKRH